VICGELIVDHFENRMKHTTILRWQNAEVLFINKAVGTDDGHSALKYKWLSVTLTTWHTLYAEVGTNFADKRRSLGRYSSLAD
jgi:hypothetical protein